MMIKKCKWVYFVLFLLPAAVYTGGPREVPVSSAFHCYTSMPGVEFTEGTSKCRRRMQRLFCFGLFSFESRLFFWKTISVYRGNGNKREESLLESPHLSDKSNRNTRPSYQKGQAKLSSVFDWWFFTFALFFFRRFNESARFCGLAQETARRQPNVETSSRKDTMHHTGIN